MLGIALAVLLLVVEGLGLVAVRDARLERGDEHRVADPVLDRVHRAEAGLKRTRCGLPIPPDRRFAEIIREREEELRVLLDRK